jgi:hypothetical protein
LRTVENISKSINSNNQRVDIPDDPSLPETMKAKRPTITNKDIMKLYKDKALKK